MVQDDGDEEGMVVLDDGDEVEVVALAYHDIHNHHDIHNQVEVEAMDDDGVVVDNHQDLDCKEVQELDYFHQPCQ